MISGLFRPLFGARNRAVRDAFAGSCSAIFLHGQGDFAVSVAGVARRQAVLREMVPASVDAGQPYACFAALVLDKGNGCDVVIGGQVIGYCPAYLATRYREWLHEWRLETARVQCRAIVHSPASASGGERQFAVKLDVELPFKLTTIQAGSPHEE